MHLSAFLVNKKVHFRLDYQTMLRVLRAWLPSPIYTILDGNFIQKWKYFYTTHVLNGMVFNSAVRPVFTHFAWSAVLLLDEEMWNESDHPGARCLLLYQKFRFSMNIRYAINMRSNSVRRHSMHFGQRPRLTLLPYIRGVTFKNLIFLLVSPGLSCLSRRSENYEHCSDSRDKYDLFVQPYGSFSKDKTGGPSLCQNVSFRIAREADLFRQSRRILHPLSVIVLQIPSQFATVSLQKWA